jgi:coproporphyrinogen III oxidase
VREQVRAWLGGLQQRICAGLEAADGRARFHEDRWSYAPQDGPGEGGGITRVMAGGAVFEKGGVNLSEVSGALNPRIAERLGVQPQRFYATGVSLVMHPENPFVPMVHLNVRYLELWGDEATPPAVPRHAWFGGGADLTPCYLFDDDARHFHACWKRVCDRHDPTWYPRFKRQCDEYFVNAHRGEARGIGGIFFDNLRDEPARTFAFVRDVGEAFLDAYVPIVARRRGEPHGAAEREWQLIRRGRYVEFNLLYDRGTRFGLETGGRTESILISLPPQVSWSYAHAPRPGSREAALVEVLRHPRDW